MKVSVVIFEGNIMQRNIAIPSSFSEKEIPNQGVELASPSVSCLISHFTLKS